jgi:general secretion pathway protein A
LQSFLLAQPQFRTALGGPELEQLRQRITAAYHLGPLSEADTRAYIEHRLRRADWNGDPRFIEAAFPLIHRYTEGVPRRINVLCSRLLLYGFLEQLHTLSESAVEKVADDLRTELSAVAVPPQGAFDGAPEALPEIDGRIRALEDKVAKHDDLIQRALAIAPRYFRAQLDFLHKVKALSTARKPRDGS